MSLIQGWHRARIINNGQYVCRSCSRRWLALETREQRAYSTERTVATDTWENNFNELSTPVVTPTTPRQTSDAEDSGAGDSTRKLAGQKSTRDEVGEARNRRQWPSFKRANQTASVSPVAVMTESQPRVELSPTQKAERFKARPGWGGLEAPPQASDKSVSSDGVRGKIRGSAKQSPVGEGMQEESTAKCKEETAGTRMPKSKRKPKETAATKGKENSSSTKKGTKRPAKNAKSAAPKLSKAEVRAQILKYNAERRAEKLARKAAERDAKLGSLPFASSLLGQKAKAKPANESQPDDEDDVPLWKVMQEQRTDGESSGETQVPTGTADEEVLVPTSDVSGDTAGQAFSLSTFSPGALQIDPLDIEQPPVPLLQHGLDRVLFNHGVYQLQDPHSRVFNFNPYLQKIMPVMEFDYNALKQYKTSSQDEMLSSLARAQEKKYIGSTSSMTGTLAHFHYLLSDFRPLNLQMLSRSFPDQLATFTKINLAPNAIFLRWKNGTYAIDADKEFDGANVLMMLGKSMEKLLTLPPAEFERYRKVNSHTVPQEERDAPEAFQYTTMGDFLMRSQLDAYDPRLPGNGMFDLKTRAVVSVRMDTADFKPMTGYEIKSVHGRFESYERELYDMMRSTMLKYMLQARMGRMDGIFIAYHNVERIFGFQYLPIKELDRCIHGQTDPCLGDQEFRASLHLLNQALDKATAKFPEKSLRLHFESKQEKLGGSGTTTSLWIFAEPMEESEIDRIQSTSKDKVAAFDREMMGIEPEVKDAAEQDGQTAVSADMSSSDTGANEAADATAAETSGSSESMTLAEPSEPLTSSRSKADIPFIKTIAAAAEENVAPLFAASLIIKTSVDGAERARPSSLQPGQKWDVEFLLQEWENSPEVWARYEACKAHRRQVLLNESDEDEDLVAMEGGKKDKKVEPYIRFLQTMSEQGRDFRSKLDRLEKGIVPVVYERLAHDENPMISSVRDNAAVKLTDIQPSMPDVQEYMGWLYAGNKEAKEAPGHE